MAIKHTVINKNFERIEVELTARKAIQLFCKECVGWVNRDVKNCTSKLCPLWPFRWYGKPENSMK